MIPCKTMTSLSRNTGRLEIARKGPHWVGTEGRTAADKESAARPQAIESMRVQNSVF